MCTVFFLIEPQIVFFRGCIGKGLLQALDRGFYYNVPVKEGSIREGVSNIFVFVAFLHLFLFGKGHYFKSPS